MAHDLKYGIVAIPGIPEDEPVFILRAKDKLALPTITRYRNAAASVEGDPRPDEFIHGLDEVIANFRDWQVDNVEQLKLPD